MKAAKITIGTFEIYPNMIPTYDILMNAPIPIPVKDLLTLSTIGDPVLEVKALERREELREEQLMFALRTFERLKKIAEEYDNKGGAVALKRAILTILSDSMFEG